MFFYKILIYFYCSIFFYSKFIIYPLKTLLGVSDVQIYAAEEDRSKCWVLAESTTASILEEENCCEKVPVGVAAKLMTVFIAADEMKNGRLTFDDEVVVSSNSNSKQGAQIWIMPNEKITVEELVKGVVIGNANDAASALAEKISGTEEKFVALMNQKASELGMRDTVFTNPNGYYDSDKQISTAADMAILACKLTEYDCFDEIFTCRIENIRNDQTMLVNSNKLISRYDGLKGYKCGWTDSSGWCGVFTAERDGKSYTAVLLGYEDEEGMLAQTVKLLDKGFAAYSLYTPELPDDLPVNIRVRNGVKNKVRLDSGKMDDIIIRTGEADEIKALSFVPEYVYAPVEKGERLGEVHFYKKDKFIFSVEIVSAGAVRENDMQNIIVKMLKKIFGF